MSPLRPFVAFLHIVRDHHCGEHEAYSDNLTHPCNPSFVQHQGSYLDEEIRVASGIFRVLFEFFSDLKIFHMKKPESESKQVWRTSDPRFDVNIDEVLLPLDEIYEMSDMVDVPIDDFIDVEGQSNSHHQSDA